MDFDDFDDYDDGGGGSECYGIEYQSTANDRTSALTSLINSVWARESSTHEPQADPVADIPSVEEIDGDELLTESNVESLQAVSAGSGKTQLVHHEHHVYHHYPLGYADPLFDPVYFDPGSPIQYRLPTRWLDLTAPVVAVAMGAFFVLRCI